jgi:hypothetical protein
MGHGYSTPEDEAAAHDYSPLVNLGFLAWVPFLSILIALIWEMNDCNAKCRRRLRSCKTNTKTRTSGHPYIVAPDLKDESRRHGGDGGSNLGDGRDGAESGGRIDGVVVEIEISVLPARPPRAYVPVESGDGRVGNGGWRE